MAAVVHNDQPGFNPTQTKQHSSTQSPSITPTLTLEQYCQLMQLLSKHSLDGENMTRSGDMVAAGFLAGKRFCMVASVANKAWIIDSGASDHITPDLSLLHNVRKI